jgi:hypothetical protein
MQIKKYELKFHYIISSLPEHNSIKEPLLEAIKNSAGKQELVKSAGLNCFSDYDMCSDFNRPWTKLMTPVFETTAKAMNELGYDGFTLKDLWYQQYVENKQHGWHIHSENFTNVYFLELPEGTPKTQFINPYNQKEIIEFDIKEGDILTCPSFVIHRSPPNRSDKRKTIVAYNTNVGYPDCVNGKTLDGIPLENFEGYLDKDFR